MLTFQPIAAKPTLRYSRAWALYEEAFPTEERRSLTQQQALLTNSAYRFLSIIHEGEFAGLLGIWQLPGGTFLEHFAIIPALRGKGVGTEVLQALVKEATPPVILEVELPLSDIAIRRISFYERAGFYLNDFEYRQPPYDKTKPWVELLLMSYPSALKAAELEEIKTQMYRQVYQQTV